MSEMKLIIVNNTSLPVDVQVSIPQKPLKAYGLVEVDLTRVEEVKIELLPYNPPTEGEGR